MQDSYKELFWEKFEFSSTSHVLEWCESNSFKEENFPQDSLSLNLKWLSTFIISEGKALVFFLLQKEGQVLGFVPFLKYPERLPLFSVGSIKVWTISITRYSSMGPPFFHSSVSGEDSKEYADSLFCTMRKSLEKNSAIFVNCVPRNSEFYKWLISDDSFKRYFISRLHGLLYQHRFIQMEGGYEDYLKQLSSKTRSDLIRTRKRFISLNPEWVVRCYTNLSEVDDFLGNAIAISKKTWQYKNAGGGLRNQDMLRERFHQTAREGWFRSYILFVKQIPIAFQVGHLLKECFNAQEIGYDPSWAKQQVGIFLHSEIVQDLFSCEKAVGVFDFGNTDTIHKQRLSNASREEGFVYLLPHNFRGRFFGQCMNLNENMTRLAIKFVEYFNIKEFVLKKINPH